MARSTLLLGTLLTLMLVAPPADADPARCQKTVISTLRKFKKVQLKSIITCVESRNLGKSGGPCPGNLVTSKNAIARQKSIDKIVNACTMADLATLGYPGNCAFEAAASGKEGQCAALPVTTTDEFARCLTCWKEAELAEFIAILYASHALDVCAGNLGESSSACSGLDCTTPLPDQRNLGDTGENDCQRAIGKAGIKYLLSREKALEKCGLAGGTSATCLADLRVQTSISKAAQRKDTYITKRCGNRDPVPNPPFCCRTGQGNQCTAATSRDDCEANLGGTVQEGKICNAGNCDPTPGSQAITWWGFCPESGTCPGAALTTLGDLIACVDASADAIVDELLCFQFATGWPCPPADGSPSGAFLAAD